MKAALERYRKWQTAITFAEAGEWETAKEMMPASRLNAKVGWLEKIFMSVAFAEAGEWETARTMLPVFRSNDQISRMERIYMGVAFAEAGLQAEAVRLVHGKDHTRNGKGIEGFLDSVGLRGVPVTYGILAFEGA